MQLRDYQRSAIDAIYSYINDGGFRPLVEMATGTGKSPTLGTLIKEINEANQSLRVLVLVHVKELVEQNYKTFMRIAPQIDTGIYAAGLGRRDGRRKVVFASIQSIYDKTTTIGAFDIVIVDEAHLISSNDDSMYGKLFADLRALKNFYLIGFTATPYRMDSGNIAGSIFDKIVFKYGIGQGIQEGYLSPLRSKKGLCEIDVSGVKRAGGEFVASSLEVAANTHEAVAGAVDEILQYAESRRLCLIFGSGVAHCQAIKQELSKYVAYVGMVTGDTPAGERARIFEDCRQGRLSYLVGMNVFTTGFDVPHVDLIAMLRPTLSTSLYVQMVGRGTRKAEGKDDCLILDFAGNVRRHGAVDLISIERRKGEKEEGAVKIDSIKAKECLNCNEFNHPSALLCSACDAPFPIVVKDPSHTHIADNENAITSFEPIAPSHHEVAGFHMNRHKGKDGKLDTLKATYAVSGEFYPQHEYWCVEHDGFARMNFETWWKNRNGLDPAPKTIDEALERKSEITVPNLITIVPDGKWKKIKHLKQSAIDRYFAEKAQKEREPELDLAANF